jgi:hypothetical protein
MQPKAASGVDFYYQHQYSGAKKAADAFLHPLPGSCIVENLSLKLVRRFA